MSDINKRIIAPSLLASDWAQLGSECQRAFDGGADWLHLDVMDGHFVDNISFGPKYVQTVRESVTGFLDVHLMIQRPDHYLERFLNIGVENITIHVEADHDVADTLDRIRKAGCGAGLSLKPDTEFSRVEPYLSQIDLLLVMTVMPGFGGQSFMEETMEAVQRAKVLREENGWGYHIQVDGGINATTAGTAGRNGANVLVAGTSVFKAPDIAAAISQLRSA